MEGSGETLIFTLPTFITSDPGHKRNDKPEMVDPQMPPVDAVNSDSAAEKKDERKLSVQHQKDERKNSKTRRSKDGTWTKKNSRSHFGYKLYTIQEVESDMIVNYAVTTASSHDSQTDLSIPGIVAYTYISLLGKSKGGA